MNKTIDKVQTTLFDALDAVEQKDWQAANIKTYDQLVAGDYVETRRPDGAIIAGWCATRHPVTGAWEIQLECEWRPGHLLAGYPLYARNQPWRFVRHDDTWTLGPEPSIVTAWMRETAPEMSVDRFHELYHCAYHAWPAGFPEAWLATIGSTFTELAIRYLPVAEKIRMDRQYSGAGRQIWSCPLRVQQQIDDEIWPLPGDQRMSALLALRWTRAEYFGTPHCPEPEGLRAFNRQTASIYEDYYRWAIAHATSPRQLLELCDAWGSNPAPKEEGGEIHV